MPYINVSPNMLWHGIGAILTANHVLHKWDVIISAERWLLFPAASRMDGGCSVGLCDSTIAGLRCMHVEKMMPSLLGGRGQAQATGQGEQKGKNWKQVKAATGRRNASERRRRLWRTGDSVQEGSGQNLQTVSDYFGIQNSNGMQHFP